MMVRSDSITSYSSARSLVTSGRLFLDANERQTGEVLSTYGLRQNQSVIETLSRNYGVASDCLIYDRGLDELISMIFRACCDSGSAVRIFTPTYGMYSIEAGIQGLDIDAVSLSKNGYIDVSNLKNNLGSPSLVILCRPNNPLGTLDPKEAVIDILELYKGICPVFIDEAYVEFCADDAGNFQDLIMDYDLLIGRTLSKAYGLAGLRLGCVLASPIWIKRLSKVQKPYPVSKLVEEYLLQNFDLSIKNSSDEWIQQVSDQKNNWNNFFEEVLKSNSFKSSTNFLCFQSSKALRCYDFLRERGVVTRYFKGDFLRVTVGSQDQLKEIQNLDWKNL